MYDLISQYLEYLELEKGLSLNTIEAYKSDLYFFAQFVNTDSLSEITRLDINHYILHLKEKKLLPTSVIRKIASLRGFFKWTSAMNFLKINPASTIEQPKIPKRLPKVMTVKEIEEIFDKVTSNGTKYYKYYAITDDKKEKLYVSTFKEAEEVVAGLKKKDSNNIKDIGIVEKYDTQIKEFTSVEKSISKLYEKKNSSKI